jgi:predicted permease
MSTFWQDVRYGLRMMRSSPGFTAVAVFALALGIGANSAIFSVVNAILLRPLAYQDPEQLVLINHNYQQIGLRASVSAAGYTYYREQNQVFEQVAALTGWNANLTGSGEPERLQGMVVSANLFATLGAEPLKGRVFLPEENQPGRNRVVVLSHGLWQRRFAGDPNLVGRTITLNGETSEVIGIMPASFQFGREIGPAPDLWGPLAFTPEQLEPQRWTNEFLVVLARLKPRVTLDQAQADLDRMAANVRQQYLQWATPEQWGLVVGSLREFVVGDIRPALLVLLAAVGCVLLIACANVANLLLARAAARQKEIAIRAALGAGRWRVVRQLLTESVLLALLGGGLGLALAVWGVDALLSINQAQIPRAYEIGLDWGVLAFTFAVSVLTGILFGLVPAFQSAKTDLHETLKEGGRSGAAHTGRFMRYALVAAEMALALVLLVGAGLLSKSFLRLQEVNPGFQPRNLLSLQLALPTFKYREPHQVADFYQQALQQIRALPGVESVGATSILPLSGTNSSGSFRIEGREVPPGQSSPHGDRWSVTPDYFQTMKIPLIKGRFFTERDGRDAPSVAIIDETMARKYWPNEDPVGKRISFEGTPENRIWREVVGIVGHVKHRGLEGESRVQYYLPHAQRQSPGMFLVARTANDPTGLASAVRGVIRGLDAELPVFRVTTLEQLVADSLSQRRFALILFGVFAGVALALAAVGLYGVMAYSVTQRTHEIGIRMALGARPGQVCKLVVGQGMRVALIGLGIGLGTAFGVTRLMASMLFGVGAKDPEVFAIISAVLTLVALVACYLPARRATRVDPMVALRYE